MEFVYAMTAYLKYHSHSDGTQFYLIRDLTVDFIPGDAIYIAVAS